MNSRLRIVPVVVCLLLVLPASAQTVRKRQNVDCLSADQLTLYRKAMAILQKRDPNNDKNVADIHQKSYRFYERLHNGVGGVSHCTHGSELFLPWHRGLLSIFEKALQETAPAEGTREIMIPYWDWTAPPSGARVPKAFMIPNDPVLNHKDRPSAAKPKLYSKNEIDNAILNSRNWVQFGGQPGTGPGAIEHPYHNLMHNWIGGAMVTDTKAAADPLFWSFHTYIDGTMARWQEEHPAEPLTCLTCELDYLPGWTVNQTVSTKALGYEYDWTPCPAPKPLPLAASALEAMPERTMALRKPLKGSATGPLVFDVSIPVDEAFRTAEIRLEGAEVPADFSYSGSVFLYPSEVALATGDATFRRRYRVGDFAVWALSHKPEAHADHAREFTLHVDATIELRYIAKKYEGQRWKVAVLVENVSPVDRDDAKKLTESQMRSMIRIDNVAIVLDRGEE